MRSFNTILLSLTALVALSTAAPVVAGTECSPSKAQSTPTIPSSGNVPDLPAPNMALQYVAVGRGIQNYTCTATGAVPIAIGAVATLFDATALAYTSVATLHSIPPFAVYQPLPPSTSPFTTAANFPIKVLGHHYFDIKGTPTFDLNSVGKILFAAKFGDVKAPPTANKGPSGTGAVDWLALSAKAGYTSVGLAEVYRVVTAGGVSPACTAPGVISVQYAAEYWFFN